MKDYLALTPEHRSLIDDLIRALKIPTTPPNDVRRRIVERLQRLNDDDVRIIDAMTDHLDRRR
jgi:hypothetical protein